MKDVLPPSPEIVASLLDWPRKSNLRSLYIAIPNLPSRARIVGLLALLFLIGVAAAAEFGRRSQKPPWFKIPFGDSLLLLPTLMFVGCPALIRKWGLLHHSYMKKLSHKFHKS